MDSSITDKLVLITGAARGQGAAAARLFAAAGARLVLLDVDRDALAKTTQPIAASGTEVHQLVVDLADSAAVINEVGAVCEDLGAFDVVYNNAGVLLLGRGDGEIHELDWSALETAIRVNLLGAMAVCRAALPAMISGGRGGSIINTSTLGALIGTQVHGYSAAKGGVISFTRSLATSYGPHGIRANTIAPGFIDTDLSKEMLANDRYRSGLEKTIPLRRIAEPEEVAEVALFLASDASRYVSGVVIPVDGGLLVV